MVPPDTIPRLLPGTPAPLFVPGNRFPGAEMPHFAPRLLFFFAAGCKKAGFAPGIRRQGRFGGRQTDRRGTAPAMHREGGTKRRRSSDRPAETGTEREAEGEGRGKSCAKNEGVLQIQNFIDRLDR